MPSYTPDPRFLDLGDGFADAVAPANFPRAVLRYRNNRAAETVGLNALSDEDWIGHFARFAPLTDNIPTPLALRYHGHQFQQYNPDIGDGRGFLFAQMRDGKGRLLDLGTKGSGQTPYSRFGDGRLTLKGGVREVLATAMLEASGVYTSKTFSLIETGEQLHRNDEPSPARSAVMVRLSHSHIRFGAFQRMAYHEDADRIGQFIRHIRTVYHTDIPDADMDQLAPAVLERVVHATANMVASWMAAGFVHGVMNTDNMNVTGETFDFGPYRFLPESDPGFTAAYFDQTGLYAFGRQPSAALWNLKQLASTFTLVAEPEDLSKALVTFETHYQRALRDATFAQLSLAPKELSADLTFMQTLFAWMTESGVPWHGFYFDWFGGAASRARAEAGPNAVFYKDAAFEPVRAGLLDYDTVRPERLQTPYFARTTPETLLIDEIEALWSAIAEKDDWTVLDAKLAGIAQKREALDLTPLSV